MEETTQDIPEVKKIKIAFFGTSDRSIAILEALKQNFDVVLCVTKNDVKVGRHQEIKETEVKSWAKKNGIKYVTVGSLKGVDLENVIETLKQIEPDYGVVADFAYIIPLQLVELFGSKLINIHFSLLPIYRGACPVQFAILNGDTTTGITYHLVDRKMDMGKIINQIGYKLAGNETSGALYDTLFELAARNLPDTITKFDQGLLPLRQQEEDKASYTYSPTHPQSTFIYKEDAQINWKKDTKSIEQAVRAFIPWPITWTTVGELENNKKLSENKLKFKSNTDKSAKVKIYETTVNNNGLLELKTVQLEGKNKTDWESFKRGYIETITR